MMHGVGFGVSGWADSLVHANLHLSKLCEDYACCPKTSQSPHSMGFGHKYLKMGVLRALGIGFMRRRFEA